MKKRTLSIILLTMIMLGFNTTYATEDFLYDDMETNVNENKSTFEEEIAMLDVGKGPSFKVYAIQANDEVAYPVGGVKIDIFYDTGDELKVLNNVNCNLVSDANGEVSTGQLPFGLYRYIVKSAPMGLTIVEGEGIFDITPLTYDEVIEVHLKITIPVVDEITKEEEKPTIIENKPVVEEKIPTTIENSTIDNSNKTDETEEYTPTVQQIQVLGNLYDSAKNDFEVKEGSEEVDIEDIPLTATIPVKIEFSKHDVIMAMRNIRITEQIRLVATIDNSTIDFYQRLAYLPKRKEDKA